MPIEVHTPYVWEARYGNTTESDGLVEYEEVDGRVIQHYFHEVDKARCTMLILHGIAPGCRDAILHLSEGMTPIFLRRSPTHLRFDGSIPSDVEQMPIHYLGWQKTIGETVIKSYLILYGDGSVEFADTDRIRDG